MRNAVIKGKSTQYVVMKWLWLHTSLNVLWGTWEIPALPSQKEAFDAAGSPEEAHRAGLKQKNTLPVSVTPACKPSWMWAKINQGATGTCIYSSSAKISSLRKAWTLPVFKKKLMWAKLELVVSDSTGKNPTDCAVHVSIGRKHTCHMRGWKA